MGAGLPRDTGAAGALFANGYAFVTLTSPSRKPSMSASTLAELDAALPKLARKVRVLEALAWPDDIEPVFLAQWRSGKAQLPKVAQQPRDHRTDIAALAELFTGSMDINRLRVLAVQQALDGADFIQVFEGFVQAGQSQEESFRSAQRVFRGADLRGGSAFTKDAAYLTGLLGVHTLLRVAVRDNRPELVSHLFAGRLSLADTLRLAPLFETGWLKAPTYVPAWASDMHRLAANLAFSAFISQIKLDGLNLPEFAIVYGVCG